MAAVLALTSLAIALVPASAQAGAPVGPRAAQPAAHDVTAHLFMWPWQDVARECRDVLGPAGYGAVQVSPPEEHVELPASGYPWWESYQPVSYKLSSRFGDSRDFAAMVHACHRAGVRVYVDAVINHMTGQASGGTGSGGTTYGYYDYPGLYGYADFHHCGRNGNDNIVNWSDRWEIQNCQLLGLADLATETPKVRKNIAGYLNSLLGMGVDGFRFDAAKHIPATDLAAITARLIRPAYIYQEALGNDPIAKTEYLPVGSVIEDGYGTQLSRVFKTGQLSWLEQFGEVWGFSPSATAVTYVDSHDTERDSTGASLTYKDGPLYDLATVFELAWPYGHPLVLSGFGFTNFDAAPPGTEANGDVSRVHCGGVTSGPGGWLCEDRTASTLGMVAFRNLVAGTSVTKWWSNGGNQIAFARGAKGFVVVNREAGSLSRTFDTGLAAGIYCDVSHGEMRAGRCSGPTVTVDASGQATVTVAGLSTLAIDVASRVRKVSVTPHPIVTFYAYSTVDPGQRLYVVGGAPELGSWDPAKAVPLSSVSYPNWSASVSIAPGTALEYKFIKKSGDGTVVWETRPNRTATVPANGWLSESDAWEAGATVDASITLHATADPGQTLYIVGGVAALGSWDPAAAVPLSQVDAGTWQGAVTLPGSASLQYKYIRKNSDGSVVWESDPNRTVTTPSVGTLTLDDTWR
jgi:alpha-amylase